jgi:hypothetical protein
VTRSWLSTNDCLPLVAADWTRFSAQGHKQRPFRPDREVTRGFVRDYAQSGCSGPLRATRLTSARAWYAAPPTDPRSTRRQGRARAVSPHKATNEGHFGRIGRHSWPCAEKRQSEPSAIRAARNQGRPRSQGRSLNAATLLEIWGQLCSRVPIKQPKCALHPRDAGCRHLHRAGTKQSHLGCCCLI